MFVCECAGSLARRSGGEHIILRDTYIYIYIYMAFYIYFFRGLAHAHVCAYMYACTYMCAYTYTYTCAHGSHLYSVYYPRDVVVRGVFRDFSWFPDGWSVDWLVGSWVEGPADLRRDV